MRPAAAMISGGKDSAYALLISYLQGFDLKVLISLIPEDEYIFHNPDLATLEKISKATKLPLVIEHGSDENALYRLLERVKRKFGIEWMVSGAVRSDFQRFIFNKVAAELGLKIHTPLWGLDGEKYVKMLVQDGFSFKIIKTGVYGLEKGIEINEKTVDGLIHTAKELRFDPSGEGGEYESEILPETLNSFF